MTPNDTPTNHEEEIVNVPYIVYESAQTRMERTVKRLAVALIIAIALIFLSNAIWLYAWMQYDYVTEDSSSEITYWQDGTGFNNMNTGLQGDITGEPKPND